MEQSQDIVRLIEDVIIPGLYIAHRDPQPQTAALSALPTQWTPESFTQFVLDSTAHEIVAEAEALIASGVPLVAVYTRFLAPAARNLGVFWQQDRCGFADVTLGVAKLHHVLHALGHSYGWQTEGNHQGRSIFLAPTPGEQHTFGLAMVEELFLQAGWQTYSDHQASKMDIVRAAVSGEFNLIGVSISCKENFDALSQLVSEVRHAPNGRSVAFLVGGRVFQDHPELVAAIPGVTVVTDGFRVVELAEALIAQSVSEVPHGEYH